MSLYLGVFQAEFDVSYLKKYYLQLHNLSSFGHFMILELVSLASVPFWHSWAGRGLCLG